MVKDAALRASKYAAKQDSTVIAARFAAQSASMIAQVNATTVTNVADETKVKSVLEPLGVQSHLFVSYYAFGRQCSKLTRKYPIQTTGSTGTLSAQHLKDLWLARGLVTGTLISIAAQFGWTVT
jgi:hypothetical protein